MFIQHLTMFGATFTNPFFFFTVLYNARVCVLIKGFPQLYLLPTLQDTLLKCSIRTEYNTLVQRLLPFLLLSWQPYPPRAPLPPECCHPNPHTRQLLYKYSSCPVVPGWHGLNTSTLPWSDKVPLVPLQGALWVIRSHSGPECFIVISDQAELNKDASKVTLNGFIVAPGSNISSGRQ